MVERHFVPSVPLVLNWLRQVGQRLKLPDACQAHTGNPGPRDGRPAFAQSMFDDTGMTRFFTRMFNWSAQPVWLEPPATCTLDTWADNTGCRFAFTEPVTRAVLNVSFGECAHACTQCAARECARA